MPRDRFRDPEPDEGGFTGEGERFGRTDPDAEKEGEVRPPEANIGNVSGLGGRRDVTGLGIQQRRQARGASLINLVPTLAETTRRALFGL